MKEISFEQFLDLLDLADSIQIDGFPTSAAHFPDESSVRIEWFDECDYEFSYLVSSDTNPTVYLNGNVVTANTEDGPIALHLFKLVPIS